MRLPDDDEIYDVDQTYLGPPGRYIGRFRYRALAIGPPLLMLAAVIVYRSGLPLTVLTVGLTVAVTVRLTQWVVDKTSQERPLRVLFAAFGHELKARRPPTKAHRSRAPRAFRHPATRIGGHHALPTGHRRRWRSYANASAGASKGASCTST